MQAIEGYTAPLALSADEQQQLESYETVIENGLQTFVEVGSALLAIRDGGLYRTQHRTFEDYCRERWQLERRRAYQLMDAAGVVKNFSHETAPKTESHAAPLAELHPEEQRLVWQVVQDTAPAGKVTAAHVKSVVNVLKEVATTGAIDSGEGEAIPAARATLDHLKAAVTEETYERMRRQEVHIQERQKHRADLVERARVASLPNKKYRVIYADPPWEYGNRLPPASTEPRDHYPTMSIADICELGVRGITEDNAVLFLWATSPLLPEAFTVIRAWGFEYKTSFVWDKVKHNVGHYNSVRHELLLVATRGACLPDVPQLFDSVVSEERTEHSRKPETFRQIIDTLYPYGKRIELFARRPVEGWETYGNELPQQD